MSENNKIHPQLNDFFYNRLPSRDGSDIFGAQDSGVQSERVRILTPMSQGCASKSLADDYEAFSLYEFGGGVRFTQNDYKAFLKFAGAKFGDNYWNDAIACSSSSNEGGMVFFVKSPKTSGSLTEVESRASSKLSTSSSPEEIKWAVENSFSKRPRSELVAHLNRRIKEVQEDIETSSGRDAAKLEGRLERFEQRKEDPDAMLVEWTCPDGEVRSSDSYESTEDVLTHLEQSPSSFCD